MTDLPDTGGRSQPTAGEHPHVHGRPASWAVVSVIIVAFIVGGLAIVVRTWWLFWVCVGVVVVSMLAGKLVGIMNDTVLVEQGLPDGRPVAEDTGSAADPGVRM